MLDALARDWVAVGWRHTPDESFNFRERLERFYDWTSNETEFFDHVEAGRTVNLTVAGYAAIWDHRIPTMKQLTNTIDGEPPSIVSGGPTSVSVELFTV